MITLAIETSATPGSVALAVGDGADATIDVRRLDRAGGHARGLAPAIAALLEARGLAAARIDLVIVGLGPGGYTGIRLALATAKTLAVVLERPILGVASTTVLAAHPAVPRGPVLTVLDAKKGDVYGARYQKTEELLPREAEAPFVRAAEEVARSVTPETFVCGDGFAVVAAARDDAPLGDASLVPRAEDLLSVGLERFRRGERDEEKSLLPLYLRPSEAELRWERRQREAEGNDG